MTDEEIDTSDIPPITDEQFQRAELRLPKDKAVVALTVDPDILAWFQAQGPEFRERMNAALRIYLEAHRKAE